MPALLEKTEPVVTKKDETGYSIRSSRKLTLLDFSSHQNSNTALETASFISSSSFTNVVSVMERSTNGIIVLVPLRISIVHREKNFYTWNFRTVKFLMQESKGFFFQSNHSLLFKTCWLGPWFKSSYCKTRVWNWEKRKIQ